MKKILIIIFLLLSINVYSLDKDMQKIDLDLIKTYKKTAGYSTVQGGVITDKYIVSFMLSKRNKNNSIVVFDKNKFDVVKVINEYDFGHANDATYNSRKQEIYVINGNKLHILDSDSLELKKTINLSRMYHAIGYDYDNDCYVLCEKLNSGTNFYIMDSEFKEIKKFYLKLNSTRQGLSIYDNHIYYATYEFGRATIYQVVYDRKLNKGDNAIYILNYDGEVENKLYIPSIYNGKKYDEIETILFNKNKMIIQFNRYNKIAYYTPSYNKYVKGIILHDNENDRLYDEDGLLVDGFDVLFYSEKEYNYVLKDENNNEKNILINVIYDPKYNSLRVYQDGVEITENREMFNNKKVNNYINNSKNYLIKFIVLIIMVIILEIINKRKRKLYG